MNRTCARDVNMATRENRTEAGVLRCSLHDRASGEHQNDPRALTGQQPETRARKLHAHEHASTQIKFQAHD